MWEIVQVPLNSIILITYFSLKYSHATCEIIVGEGVKPTCYATSTPGTVFLMFGPLETSSIECKRFGALDF